MALFIGTFLSKPARATSARRLTGRKDDFPKSPYHLTRAQAMFSDIYIHIFFTLVWCFLFLFFLLDVLFARRCLHYCGRRWPTHNTAGKPVASLELQRKLQSWKVTKASTCLQVRAMLPHYHQFCRSSGQTFPVSTTLTHTRAPVEWRKACSTFCVFFGRLKCFALHFTNAFGGQPLIGITKLLGACCTQHSYTDGGYLSGLAIGWE